MIPREAALQSIVSAPLDLLVVGGGVVGAAVARDAALRGYRTALVEQYDFAWGTSSRSSRLLHGGLRYLAQGRIGLVREASQEKEVLRRIAPHLAQPLPFVFPVYQGNRHWVLWQLKAGVKIYDALCSGRNLGRSSWLDRRQTLEAVPGLTSTGLQGAVRYFDGFTQDARLTLDTLRSAARAGATVLNYCRFAAASRQGDWRCTLEDRLRPRTLQARARSVVNATGPWAPGLAHSRVQLRLTKGVHLVIDRSRLPLAETTVMADGQRILFAIPWGERVILGTTDTDYAEAIEEARTDARDRAEILTVVNRLFPQANLSPADVLSSWAGLRPLIADPHGRPSDISRSHQIQNPEPGWWDVAGGKLTTCRLMAEQTLDRIIRSKQLPPPAHACRTAAEPLLPAEPPPTASHGEPAPASGFSGILPPPVSRAAVHHFCAEEWAVHLEDVMTRRAGWRHYLPHRLELGEQVAEWMGEALGWTPMRRRAELQSYLNSSASR